MSDRTFHEFVEFLSNSFGVNPSRVNLSASLVDDLGLDSLEILELAIEVEEVGGVAIHSAAVAEIRTIADLFAYWTRGYNKTSPATDPT
jgi:acyl carrier protein